MSPARQKTDGRKSRPKAKSLGRIVVVEDDAVLALALEDALLAAGASEVVLCPSTARALEALEEADAAAIVIDVHLADRDDGWALAELVNELGPRHPRIIFSTGSPEAIPPEIAGMGLMLEKPYDPVRLAEALASGTPKVGLLARLRGAVS
ncbi:MAG: response regulator [Sphingomonadales bacterium 32-68-7]|nr:MAG: response regulator [Sphingomonadales bacterium 12-68-11]OYX09607.1 MAG: response regulator [Sphingomonadales bacterium 32-68-7]